MDRDKIFEFLADDTELTPELIGTPTLDAGVLADAISMMTRGAGRRAIVRVRGLTIDGIFDLSSTSLPNGPGLPDIEIADCTFTDAVDLSDTQFGRLAITDSRLSELLLQDAWVRTSARFLRLKPLRDGLKIRANRFRSGGDLDFSGSHLVFREPAAKNFVHDFGDAEFALMFRDATIGGNVVLNSSRGMRFIAEGGVMCTGSKVEGEFSLTGAHLVAVQSDALRAKFAQIGGSLALTTGFEAEGRVTIASAQLRGGVEIMDATFENKKASFANEAMVVLEAGNASIGGSVEIGSGTTVRGAIGLAGVRISGGLDVSRTTFIFPGRSKRMRTCIHAVGSTVDGSVSLGPEVETTGTIDFAYARVGGAFRWDDLTMQPDRSGAAALKLDNATLGRGLEARKLISAFTNVVSLTGLKVSSLDDELDKGWGDARVELGGLFYDWVSDRDNQGWEKRDAWLIKHTRCKRPFNAQPFAQYASWLQRSGAEEASRLVILSAERLETSSSNGFRKFWRRLYGLCFGYGLRPRNALVTIAVQIGLAAFLTMGANHIGWMTLGSSPVKSVIGSNGAIGFARGADAGRDPYCGKAINSLIYATDVVIPLLDLREEGKCDVISDGVAGSFASVVKALFAVLGWVVTSLVILTCSGAIRRLQS